MSTRVVTEKDKIIDKFANFHPGLRDLITVIMPGFETYYMDDTGCLHLVDKINRRGVSIVMENSNNAFLQLKLNDQRMVSFRLSVLKGNLGINQFNDFASGEITSIMEN